MDMELTLYYMLWVASSNYRGLTSGPRIYGELQ